jgi:acyltransferase
VPYVFFFLVAWSFWIITSRLGHRAEKFANVGWDAPLKGLITGLSSDLSIVNPTLWFFPCFLFVMVYYFGVRKFASKGVSTVLFGLLAVTAVAFSRQVNALPFRLPWGLDVACVATGFYAFGQQLRGPIVQVLSNVDWVWRTAVLAVAALCFLAAWPPNGAVDMQAQLYGITPWLFFVASLGGIASTVLIASLFPASIGARWLSDNTLIIFPTHTLAFVLVSGLSQLLFGFSPATQAGIGYALGATVLALICAIPTVALLRRPLGILAGSAPVVRRLPTKPPLAAELFMGKATQEKRNMLSLWRAGFHRPFRAQSVEVLPRQKTTLHR